MDRINRLALARREQRHVLVADADGLRTVNDTLGHTAGGVLVSVVGHRLGAWAGARSGMAARLGGDEFGAALLLPPAATAREITGLCEIPGRPVDMAGQVLRPAVSSGVGLSGADGGQGRVDVFDLAGPLCCSSSARAVRGVLSHMPRRS